MRLQSIELKGFKSFRDKTIITFDNQISAIVGPNGSGKSNVSDAIRWVLGEQSVKSLRGAKMNDVIFQGGDGSSPLNLAEVNLTFDNKDKSLNLDYNKVTISRRIYRDGENEYKINGKKVRLRDVRELFLDTGIGKEGYSIIGQGRIDEIINSSNEKRRAIFEEASGISKHKYRRDEASKNLSKVTEDLELIEYEWEYKKKDLEKLKIEANNYQKFLNLSDELNEKSYYYLVDKSKSLTDDKKDAEENIKDINLKIKEFDNKLQSINEKLAPFNDEYETLTLKLSESQDKLKALEKTNQTSLSKIELNKQKLSYNQKDLDRFTSNLSNNSKRLEDFKFKLNELNKEFNEKKKSEEIYKDEISKSSRSLDELNTEVAKIKDEINVVLDEKSTIDKIIYDYEITVKTNELLDKKLKEDFKENLERIRSLNLDLKTLDGELGEIKANKLKLFDESNKSSQVISNLERDIQGLSSQIDQLNIGINQNDINLKTAINQYKFSKSTVDRNEGYFYSVSDFLNKTKESNLEDLYEDTLANLVTIKDGYEEIIDNLMGAALQNIVTKTKDDTSTLIKFVNKNNIGRITFLPIDSIKGYTKERPSGNEVIAMAYELLAYDDKLSSIINHFLGSTVVVRNIDDAISLSKKISGYRIITLDLDVINSWGSMVAGSNKNKKANTAILNRGKKLEEQKKEITRLREKHSKLTNNIENLYNEKNTLENELKALRLKFNENQNIISKYDIDISSINIKIDNLKSRKEELEAKTKLKSENLENIDIDELYKKRDKLADILNKLYESQNNIEAEIKRLEDYITDSKNKLELTNRDINMLTNSIGQTSDEVNNLSYSQKMEEKLKKDNEDEISAVSKENDNLIKLININYNKIQRLDEFIKSINRELKTRENENKVLIENLKKLEDEKNKLDLQRVRLEYKLESTNKDYENLVDDIKPFISLEISELKNKYQGSKIQKVSKESLISLQKNINNIGYFTEDSMENYEEISKDFEFINNQMIDLKESKLNIEKMIGTLESEMKDEFKRNFDIINEKFSRIFEILFMGGKAELKLDSDDTLTAGVDIIARPPSKSLKSISLLSGGEKALTAVALLFAIFETNPAPFAILDEIDAALDETNIKRYIEYLTGLSEKSQFIMITHRQTTMQLAEKIYGVTIGDDGVSKLYSIDFDKN